MMADQISITISPLDPALASGKSVMSIASRSRRRRNWDSSTRRRWRAAWTWDAMTAKAVGLPDRDHREAAPLWFGVDELAGRHVADMHDECGELDDGSVGFGGAGGADCSQTVLSLCAHEIEVRLR